MCGIGGAVEEKGLIGIDSLSRPGAEFALRSLLTAKQPRKVLLLPAAPPGALGGEEGNPLMGELIDSYHPDLCVVAGSSQRRGSEHVGHTLVVNPGCLADGWAAWLEWKDKVEFVNLRTLAGATPTPSRAGTAPPSDHEIRLRAYLRWEAAGKPQGDESRFWLQAEEELRRQG